MGKDAKYNGGSKDTENWEKESERERERERDKVQS